MKNPLVSIIIPVYNGANYVAEAIDSALAQTYKNIEIIVINDGSRDDGATDDVVSKYGDKVVYIKKENGGVSSALNLGIKTMKGDYFSWLSHDDLYVPEKIERQVAVLKESNDIVLCSGSLMDKNKKRISHHVKKINKTLNGEELFTEFLHGYVLNGLGFLVPKRVFERVGLFDENMRYLQDLDMWLRIMMLDYHFICQEDELVISRVHANQTTNLLADHFNKDRVFLANKHIKLINSLNLSNKESLLLLYLKLFVKGKNRNGENLIKDALKEEGYNLSVINIKAFPYYVYGFAKNTQRKLLYMYWKFKGIRK